MKHIRNLAELRRNAKYLSKQKIREVVKGILKEQREDTRSVRKRQTEYDDGDALLVKGMVGKSLLKQIHKSRASDGLEIEFQEQSDAVYIANQVLKASGQGGLRKTSKAFKRLTYLGTAIQKAMYSTSVAEGDEFVPTELSRSLIDLVRVELKVAALHSRITMPTNPYELPLEGADIDVLFVGEATTDNTSTEANKIGAATPGTGKITFSAKKLALRTVWSDELDQDSIIPITEYIRKKLALAMANGQEEALINGDNSGTHQDADIEALAATDRRKAFKGYRVHALAAAKIDNGNAAISLANFRLLKTAMGKYGLNPSNGAIVVGITGYNQLLEIPEVQTMDKVGTQAVILNGMLGALDGFPIIVSEFIREDLNASGVEDGATTDRTVLHLVHTGSFLWGDRLNTTMKSAENIETDQIIMVIKQRVDWVPTQVVTTEKIVGTLYNIST